MSWELPLDQSRRPTHFSSGAAPPPGSAVSHTTSDAARSLRRIAQSRAAGLAVHTTHTCDGSGGGPRTRGHGGQALVAAALHVEHATASRFCRTRLAHACSGFARGCRRAASCRTTMGRTSNPDLLKALKNGSARDAVRRGVVGVRRAHDVEQRAARVEGGAEGELGGAGDGRQAAAGGSGGSRLADGSARAVRG